MKPSSVLYLLASLLTLLSCSKEKSLETNEPPTTNKLIGNYNFAGMTAATRTTTATASGNDRSWSGDTFFILTKFLTTSSRTVGGEVITNTSEGVQLVKLKRK